MTVQLSTIPSTSRPNLPATATYKPVGNRVMVKRHPELTMTKGGIYIPDTCTEKPMEGTVVAIGDGRTLDNGTHIPSKFTIGEEVVFAKFAGVELINNKTGCYILLGEDEILCRIKRDKPENQQETQLEE